MRINWPFKTMQQGDVVVVCQPDQYDLTVRWLAELDVMAEVFVADATAVHAGMCARNLARLKGWVLHTAQKDLPDDGGKVLVVKRAEDGSEPGKRTYIPRGVRFTPYGYETLEVGESITFKDDLELVSRVINSIQHRGKALGRVFKRRARSQDGFFTEVTVWRVR